MNGATGAGAGAGLPYWLKVGTPIGLLLIGLSAVIPQILRRSLDMAPKGSINDPLPPDYDSPPPAHFTFPSRKEVTTQQVDLVLRRRWASMFGSDLTHAQVVPLLAHVALATKRGKEVVSNNIFGMNADRFYTGMWSAAREPEWKNGQPLFRWNPIRAYWSLDAAAHDWFRSMGPVIQAAVEAGDLDAYANGLSQTGAVMLPPHLIRPELKAEARRFLRAA